MVDSRILVPVSLGELVDKIAILSLKIRHLSGEALLHVETEFSLLQAVLHGLDVSVDPLFQHDLLAVNAALWDVEDQLRQLEDQGEFGDDFVQLARRVYQLNDRRHLLKRAISSSAPGGLIEEKSYA